MMEERNLLSGKGYVELGEDGDESIDGDFVSRPAHQESTRVRIHELLAVLRAPLPRGGMDTEVAGHLLRERKNDLGQWQPHWAAIKRDEDGGLCLFYQEAKDEGNGLLPNLFKKTRGKPTRIPLTFIACGHFTPHDTGSNEGRAMTDHYLKVFSKYRSYTFAARSEEEFEDWAVPVSEMFISILGKEEYNRREQAAQGLEPLLRQRYYRRLRDAQEVLSSFAAAGFFEDNVRSGKEKEATLLMRDGDSEDCWTAYRFILKAKCIYYYLVTKRKQSYHDYRVIPLKYATITWREKAEDDGSWMFSITTPIVTYTLKAKHKVAMEEWVEAIARSRKNLGKKKGVKLSSSNGDDYHDAAQLVLDSQPEEEGGLELRSQPESSHRHGRSKIPIDVVADKPYLEIMKASYVMSRKKLYRITKTVTTIGRSAANDIRVDDSRISREHARIDTVDNKLIFVDLGSKRGSKLNHHMVANRQVLYPDDIIKVGRTIINVRVGHAGK